MYEMTNDDWEDKRAQDNEVEDEDFDFEQEAAENNGTLPLDEVPF